MRSQGFITFYFTLLHSQIVRSLQAVDVHPCARAHPSQQLPGVYLTVGADPAQLRLLGLRLYWRLISVLRCGTGKTVVRTSGFATPRATKAHVYRMYSNDAPSASVPKLKSLKLGFGSPNNEGLRRKFAMKPGIVAFVVKLYCCLRCEFLTDMKLMHAFGTQSGTSL